MGGTWYGIPESELTPWQRNERELQRLIAMREGDRPNTAIQALLDEQDKREHQAGLEYLNTADRSMGRGSKPPSTAADRPSA